MPSFSAQVEQFVLETQERIDAVARASVQDLAAEMIKPRAKGGRMRVVTGFLRASLLASTSAAPRINPTARPASGQTFGEDLGQVSVTIANWNTEISIFLGFTASYAAAREFGANGQPGDAFVTTAAMRWQEIVNNNVSVLRGRLSAPQ